MKKLIENLTQKGYHVHVFCDKESAAAYMNQAIDGKTVGIGGSVTVRQMGLFPML
ncbi:MAG: LUD domain-containing protein, partial [Anaerovoracaceae bacterium]